MGDKSSVRGNTGDGGPAGRGNGTGDGGPAGDRSGTGRESAPAGRRSARAAARRGLWTRSFVVISLVNFLNAVVFLLLMIVMSKVATERFGASPAVAGLSASIFVIGAFVTRPFIGKRIHRIGQTKTLYIGSFLSVLLTLVYFAANNNGLLILVRFLHGAAHGTAALATGTIVAGVLPRDRYGEGMGYFTLGQTLSTAIAPALGLLLLQHGGFDALVVACAAASAIALALLPLLGVKDLQLTEEQRAETEGFKLSNYVEPKAVPIAVALMVTYLCYSSVSSFLALYSEKIQLAGAAGVFFVVYAVVIFLSRPLVGQRFDAKGENSVMYAAILGFVLSLAILALARHWSGFLLAAVIMGLGFGTIQACGRAIMVKVTPLHRMGQATSTFYIFGDTGLGLGPLFCGLLIPLTGYRGMYGTMAVLAALSLVLYHMLHGRHVGRGAAGAEGADVS